MSTVATTRLTAGMLAVAGLAVACSSSPKPLGPWCFAHTAVGGLPALVSSDIPDAASDAAYFGELAELNRASAERAPAEVAADASLVASFTEAVATLLADGGLDRLQAYQAASGQYSSSAVEAARARLDAFAASECVP